jgi:thymidylate synthase (FAD)
VTDILYSQGVDVKLVRQNTGDVEVVHAAQVSTLGDLIQERFSAWDREVTDVEHPDQAKNRGLINFLMRDRHGSPFEHNSMTFFIQAPIFVAREFMRHRVGWSYNEESGRYKELRPLFYIPGEERKLVQVGRPGAYRFEHGSDSMREDTEEIMQEAYQHAWYAYREMLDLNVAREVARMVLPVGIFTTFYATCNARSLMHFLSLRTINEKATVPSFPQREIELVADQMEEQWAKLMPLTHWAFNEHGRVAP